MTRFFSALNTLAGWLRLPRLTQSVVVPDPRRLTDDELRAMGPGQTYRYAANPQQTIVTPMHDRVH